MWTYVQILTLLSNSFEQDTERQSREHTARPGRMLQLVFLKQEWCLSWSLFLLDTQLHSFTQQSTLATETFEDIHEFLSKCPAGFKTSHNLNHFSGSLRDAMAISVSFIPLSGQLTTVRRGRLGVGLLSLVTTSRSHYPWARYWKASLTSDRQVICE